MTNDDKNGAAAVGAVAACVLAPVCVPLAAAVAIGTAAAVVGRWLSDRLPPPSEDTPYYGN